MTESWRLSTKKFLYCAAYDTLNDPMEGLFRSTIGVRMANIRDSIIENRARIGICSFTLLSYQCFYGKVRRRVYRAFIEMAALIVLGALPADAQNTTFRKKIYIRWCCIDRLSS